MRVHFYSLWLSQVKLSYTPQIQQQKHIYFLLLEYIPGHWQGTLLMEFTEDPGEGPSVSICVSMRIMT